MRAIDVARRVAPRARPGYLDAFEHGDGLLAMRLALAVAGVLAAASLLAMPLPAPAHDHWINDQRLTDPMSGEWCCNEQDCAPEPAGAVRETSAGYLIVATGETIPFARAIPRSADGRFWRCKYLVGE